MPLILHPHEIGENDRPTVGGKAFALARLVRAGFQVPGFLSIASGAYREFVSQAGLGERIMLELHRKEFKQMRWEEIWDCATRIRNLFLRAAMPVGLAQELRQAVSVQFGERPVAVRSSAPDEDDAQSSFAGLHESHLNLRGAEAIIDHTRKVWASLWSDAALLYRQELKLDVAQSAMAVVVQEMAPGERSGIAFSQNPSEPSQAVVEAVHGLNQGLVDGAVEPDRWVVDRDFGRIMGHTPARRERWAVAGTAGIELAALPDERAQRPPLASDEVQAVYELAKRAEAHFGRPQDVEWTIVDGRLLLLQSRPVTTRPQAEAGDQRAWYLSLHRSFDNLKALRRRIEHEQIPAMIQAAEALAGVELPALSDPELIAEIRRRWEINDRWVKVYWSDFIPFAHGIRLFGQVYNDALRPADPYEFIDLLTRTDMASLARNRLLEQLADQVRCNPDMAACLKRGDCGEQVPAFQRSLEAFIGRFGDLSCTVTGGTQCAGATRPLERLLLELAAHPGRSAGGESGQGALEKRVQQFAAAFPEQKRAEALEILELARASYRLRDDDNIHLGRIEAQLTAALQEGRRRLESGSVKEPSTRSELNDFLESVKLDSPAERSPARSNAQAASTVAPRQLVGQPAGPGVARGSARVVRRHADLDGFCHGEVLVCDAVDPNMTFVVPLAAAVVERRGGMLIHGAIIAREYGLPCVTGIPDATELIRTGDPLTVDGYLGIVTVSRGGSINAYSA
ncbi:MAG: PEP-utilizing enzyme [Desulfobacterales bacterium]|jgi:pyruvate,water dikinase|nr:PEP-utilizing enzyme [Desulfobacterales bacterium]